MPFELDMMSMETELIILKTGASLAVRQGSWNNMNRLWLKNKDLDWTDYTELSEQVRKAIEVGRPTQ